VRRVTGFLREYGVDLLLVHVGAASTLLADALGAANIAWVPLATASEVAGAAALCGASVVEDLVSLRDCDIGRAVTVRVLMELPTTAAISKDASFGLNATTDTGGVMLNDVAADVAGDGELVLGVGEERQLLVALSRYRGFLDQPHQSPRQAPVSVVLTAPTAAMTAALRDRFLRCLHRLVAVRTTGLATVMPGGGLPELVAVLRISEIVAALQTAEGCEVTYIVGVLRICQQCLLTYISSILLSNGFTNAEAQQSLDEAVAGLSGMLGASVHADDLGNKNTKFGNKNTVDVSVLSSLARLSPMEKTKLRRPVELSKMYGAPSGGGADGIDGIDSSILDAVELKTRALECAVMAVVQLLTTEQV